MKGNESEASRSGSAERLFAGPGETRALLRAFDWSTTPLGTVDTWPLSLRTIVATLLASKQPMFLWWGPAFVQLYNDAYRPSFGAGDRHVRAIGAKGPEFWTELWDFVSPQIAQVMSGGEATWNEDQLVPIRRNGRLEDVWWTYSYGPAHDDDGNVAGVLVVCQETTDYVHARRESERARLEAEAAHASAVRAHEAERQARQAAEAANRAKSEFLAIMSHELRTPLNAIDGYAELMELGIHGTLTDDQRQDLGRIRKSQRHLLGLINGVLNYARIEAGAIRYDIGDVIVDDVLATCEALIAPQARAKRLVLEYPNCDRSLIVRADAEKLQQIVLNLLSNSVKFTEPGGRLGMGCAVNNDGIRIVVSDSGRGIAPDQLARVFEPFVQVDVRLVRTQDGVGLGLAISRDLARGMGGDLTGESTLGVGTQFTLSLPRVV